MKKKKLWLILPALVMMLLLTALILRSDWRYLCVDVFLRQTLADPPERLEASELELETYSRDELAESGVTWDRSLMLVNEANHLPEDYQPQLIDYHQTGAQMDENMEADFAALCQAVEERFGQRLLVRSGYRTREEQAETIVQNGDVAAQLDASEHQAGLALDVCVPGYAGRALLKTETGRYINDRCWEYGFIIRYPYYGTSSTGIGYEPWHLRYVGSPHAQIIMENSWTLEEYEEKLEPGTFWRFGDTVITRQIREPYLLPGNWTQASASPDNQGGVIFTLTFSE